MAIKQASISTVTTFPPGFFLENITTLPDDTILVTVANRKCIYAIPPATVPGKARQPFLLHQFEDDAWAFGITTSESDPNLTYVLTTDFTSQGSCTHHLHLLDISNVAAADHLTTLMQFPSGAKGLNGLTTLNDSVLVAADSFAGCIWRIDLEFNANGRPTNARASEWMKDATFTGKLVLPDFQPGVNGLKYSPKTGVLVFSNTQQRLLGKIPVNAKTLDPDGPPQVILRGPQGDDLIIDDHFKDGPVAYLTTHRDNSILRVAIEDQLRGDQNQDNSVHVVAQVDERQQLVLGPTSGTWKRGKEGQIAYFNCDGGLKNPLLGAPAQFARILKVNLGGEDSGES